MCARPIPRDPSIGAGAPNLSLSRSLTVATDSATILRHHPTRSRGINRIAHPCFRNTFPLVCDGFIPTPSSVMMALVAGGTLNSSAANLSTAVNGACSGTERTRKGSLGSLASVILKVTFALEGVDGGIGMDMWTKRRRVAPTGEGRACIRRAILPVI